MLGPLNAATAHERLTRSEFLTPDAMLRRAVYGEGQGATTVVVNFGAADQKVELPKGGNALLPPWGFVIQVAAAGGVLCQAIRRARLSARGVVRRASGRGHSLDHAARIRIFHGFGDAKIYCAGRCMMSAGKDCCGGAVASPLPPGEGWGEGGCSGHGLVPCAGPATGVRAGPSRRSCSNEPRRRGSRRA